MVRKVISRAALIAGIVIVAALSAVVGSCALRRPSANRLWSADSARPATAVIDEPFVYIRDVRNFEWKSETESVARYYDRVYDLRKLDSVWFVVEPFGEFEGAAHTFVSFGFDGGKEYVAISVEIRKEAGESYSALRGLLREYEIMYVIGDERDLIRLRTNYRRDLVYLYPVRTTKERTRKLFVEMVTRANALAQKPEFYNTATNTCTTNIVRHVNTIRPKRVPPSYKVLLPGYADRLAYDLGLIDTTLPFEAAKARFRVDEKARRIGDAEDFSQRVRQ